MRIKGVILLSLLSCILITGCWDKAEIDKKIFVSTIGIDVGMDIGKISELKKIKPSDPFAESEIKKLSITYGFPDISKFQPGQGGTLKDANITTEAYSMQDAISKAVVKSSRSIDFGHTRLLMLSKDLMNYPIVVKEIVDYLQRQPSLSRNMYVMLVEGKVEEYIKFKPSMEKSIEAYLTGVMENGNENGTVLPVTLNEFLILLSENGNSILPTIKMDKLKNEVALSGVALIKDYKINGYLNAVETSDLEILRGKIRGGKKTIYVNGHPVDYAIEGIERKITMSPNSQKLAFNIDIRLEGQLKDYNLNEKVFSENKINSLQENFNESLNKECYAVIKLTQNKFKEDPIGIREYVEKFHPDIWNKVKGNWEEAYKNSNINVNIKTKIRRIGAND